MERETLLGWVSQRLPARAPDSHKHQNGRVLIVAGNPWMPGAALLAAMGALRAGAGLTQVSGSPEVRAGAAARLPECLPISERPEQFDASRVDAMAIGPGLGRFVGAGNRFREWRNAWTGAWVADADALYWMAHGESPPAGPGLITPHEGELAMLIGAERAEVSANREGAARTAADRFGQTVLLKGRETIVVGPGTAVLASRTGNSGLATGGTGDVLTGIVATLLAQGLKPFEAALCGACWHGLAAELCAEQIGPTGYLASEVADRLPAARVRWLS